MENALTGININETRNNYGIDRDYVVGTAKQAVVGVQRQLFRTYQVAAQYGHTIGSNLEIVRAPNRDADGLRIEGVQPFTWTSSEGRSVLDSASVQLRKNESRGFGYQVEYTLRQVARQLSVDQRRWRRRHGQRRAGRSEHRRRVGQVELRAAPPLHAERELSLPVRAATSGGSITAASGPGSPAAGG